MAMKKSEIHPRKLVLATVVFEEVNFEDLAEGERTIPLKPQLPEEMKDEKLKSAACLLVN
jgi:hypothetical protein